MFQGNASEEILPVDMYDAGLDLKKGENVYETRTAYTVNVPLRKDSNKIREFISFVGCRVLSLVIETVSMYLMVDIILIRHTL